jgi:hypothetical protein
MNTSLDSVTLPSSIQEIVEQVFRSSFLSLGQENRINELLFQLTSAGDPHCTRRVSVGRNAL